MAVLEGKWRCKSCDSKNRGRDLVCASCGEQRGEVEFFIEDDAAPVTEPELLARAEAGADWICAYCKQSNQARAERCDACGAPRAEGKTRASGELIETPYHSASEQRHARSHPSPSPSPSPSVGFSEARGFTRFYPLVAIALVLLCGFGGMLLSRRGPPVLSVASVSWVRAIALERLETQRRSDWTLPDGARKVGEEQAISSYREVQVGTRDVEKTRTVQTGTKKIPIERTRTVRTGTKKVPITTTRTVQTGTKRVAVTKTRSVQVGTKKVKTGVRDKGNGFFEEVFKKVPIYEDRSYTDYEARPVYEQRTETTWKEKAVYGEERYTEIVEEPVYGEERYTETVPVIERQPVYATRFKFDVDVWVFDREEKAEGRDLAPRWPEPRLDAEEGGAKRRVSGRREELRVVLADGAGWSAEYRPRDEQDLARFALGSRWIARSDGAGAIAELTPAR